MHLFSVTFTVIACAGYRHSIEIIVVVTTLFRRTIRMPSFSTRLTSDVQVVLIHSYFVLSSLRPKYPACIKAWFKRNSTAVLIDTSLSVAKCLTFPQVLRLMSISLFTINLINILNNLNVGNLRNTP